MSINTNLPSSDLITVAAVIDPQDASGTLTTPWLDFGQFINLMVVLNAGAITTLDAKLEQAINPNNDADSKIIDVPDKAITTLTDSNKQVILNAHHGNMKMEEDYRYIRLSVTATGLISGTLLAVQPSHGPAGKIKSVDLVEIV